MSVKTLFASVLAAFALACSLAAAADKDDGFTPLFDGKTLQGWKQLGGNAKFTVEDGQIVGASVPNSKNSFLCTEKTYRDFILELEFKVDDELNSGVQIRSESTPEYQKGRVHGYQVEIDPESRAWSGGIYDEGRRGWLCDLKNNEPARKAFRHNQWNKFHIECVGDSIKTWINGVPAAELKDGMTKEGFIGLQVHAVGKLEKPLYIRFREIRLKELHPQANTPAKPHVLVTISKETTYITEPLRADGYPDYVAALNQRASEGVTPENNAAVLFWKAIGWPEWVAAQDRDQFFKMLGIQTLPEKGDYYVAFYEYAGPPSDTKKLVDEQAASNKAMGTLDDQMDQAAKRPWSRREFPAFAGWLEANEKPLALLVEAFKRPRRYDPEIGEKNGLAFPLVPPALPPEREACRALLPRAMLRAHDGQVDQAWADLLSCHRHARLVAQGPWFIETLVAYAINAQADAGNQGMLQHAKLSAARLMRMRDELDKLPPMPRMADKIDVGERFTYLSIASYGARSGIASMMESLGSEAPKYKDGIFKKMADSLAEGAIDWDVVLRTGNSWYDRLVEAFRKRTRGERKAALDKIADGLRKAGKEAEDWKSLPLSVFGEPRRDISERVGKALVSLCCSGIPRCVDSEDRAAMQFELTKLAFTLAAYRADHGSYPAKLAGLAPKYVAEVPKDIFIDAELRYKQEGDGYLLYSVGPNGKDDGARGFDDRKEDEDWDDLVVRMPAAVEQKQK